MPVEDALDLVATFAVLTPHAPRAQGLQAELVDASEALVLSVSYDRSATHLSIGPDTGCPPGTRGRRARACADRPDSGPAPLTEA